MLSLLPPYQGKRILELASGIGRFTGSIAGEASGVVTVEFMEDFLEKVRGGGLFVDKGGWSAGSLYVDVT